MVALSFFKQFLSMSKIRINELARELEVKPNRILELLPEFGVEEKKTHSSSIDEDVAIAIKKKLGSFGLGLCLPEPSGTITGPSLSPTSPKNQSNTTNRSCLSRIVVLLS